MRSTNKSHRLSRLVREIGSVTLLESGVSRSIPGQVCSYGALGRIFNIAIAIFGPCCLSALQATLQLRARGAQ